MIEQVRQRGLPPLFRTVGKAGASHPSLLVLFLDSQRPFRTRNAEDATVSLNRLPQRARGSFERALENVMRVAPAQAIDVQIELRRLRK